MRCNACQESLTDSESTRKDTHGQFVDLCNTCYHQIRADVKVINNFDTNIIENQILEK